MVESRPTVLVMDDETQIRRFLRAGLELQGFEVREDGSANFSKWKCGSIFSVCKKIIDITEDPRRAMRGAAEHYSSCAGEIKHCARFLR